MQLILLAGLSAVAAAATTPLPSKPRFLTFTGPAHAEQNCPKPAFKPGDPVQMRKLNELPPGDVYLAVYRPGSCPAKMLPAKRPPVR